MVRANENPQRCANSTMSKTSKPMTRRHEKDETTCTVGPPTRFLFNSLYFFLSKAGPPNRSEWSEILGTPRPSKERIYHSPKHTQCANKILTTCLKKYRQGRV